MELKPVFPMPTNINQTNYYWYQEGLNSEDLTNLDKLAATYPYTKGTIVGNDEIVESIRKSKIKWIHPNDDSQWLYDKIINMVVEANNTMWNFNLYSVIDSIQYTEYLELWYGGSTIQIPKNKGLTVIFPSFSMHRVTPITKGVRKSLVLWVGGEHYK